MSGYGWNSGYVNLNGGGFNRALPTYPNPGQEHCVLCNHVFFTTEALVNHYETHMRDDELALRAIREGNLPHNPFQQPFNPLNAPNSTPQALLQNNYVRLQNQLAQQRNLALGPHQPLFSASVPPPQAPPITRPIPTHHAIMQPPQAPPTTRNVNTIIQPQPQQQQQQRQLIQPAVQMERRQNLVPPNAYMRARAPVAQLNQLDRPDEIELDFGDDDNSSPDRSINLDLTLGL